jgi:quinol monooxygenase YgiN
MGPHDREGVFVTDEQIGWVIEVSVRDGELARWKELMREMVASASAEPGTLTYEWMLGDDGTTCQLFERYTNVAAAAVHSRAFDAKFASRFFALASPVRLSVYGTPDAELRAAQAPLAPGHFQRIGGFERARGAS